MSDYRNSNDPLRRDTRYDPDTRGTSSMWSWIAGAVFLVIVVAVAFSVGRTPNHAGSDNNLANNVPPASSRMTPPTPAPPVTGPANPSFTPAPGSTTAPPQ